MMRRTQLIYQRKNYEELDKLFPQFPGVKWDSETKNQLMHHEHGIAQKVLNSLEWV